MDNIFDKKINRVENSERKWSKEYLQKNYNIDFTKTYYNLSIADLDFESPKPVVEAIVNRAHKNTYSYTYVEDESIQAISNWYQTIHNLKINTKLVKLVHGTVNAMFEIVKQFTKENDYVLIQSPIYQPFERSIRKTNRRVAYNKLIYKENRYYIDFLDFENQIKEHNIKLFLWCNPHNPGGRVWSELEVKKILEICNKYDVLVLSDEVHGDLNIDIQHNSILKYSHLIKNYIMCNSPNKTFNLGGLKGSFIVCSNKDILDGIESQYENDSITSPNVFFQPALVAAYTNQISIEWFLDLKKYLKNNYELFFKFIKKYQQIELMDMESSYLVWLKLNYYKSWEQIKQTFYKNNLIVSFSEEFSNCENGWVRINIGLNENELNIVFEKLKIIFKELEIK